MIISHIGTAFTLQSFASFCEKWGGGGEWPRDSPMTHITWMKEVRILRRSCGVGWELSRARRTRATGF